MGIAENMTCEKIETAKRPSPASPDLAGGVEQCSPTHDPTFDHFYSNSKSVCDHSSGCSIFLYPILNANGIFGVWYHTLVCKNNVFSLLAFNLWTFHQIWFSYYHYFGGVLCVTKPVYSYFFPCVQYNFQTNYKAKSIFEDWVVCFCWVFFYTYIEILFSLSQLCGNQLLRDDHHKMVSSFLDETKTAQTATEDSFGDSRVVKFEGWSMYSSFMSWVADLDFK